MSKPVKVALWCLLACVTCYNHIVTLQLRQAVNAQIDAIGTLQQIEQARQRRTLNTIDDDTRQDSTEVVRMWRRK